MIEFLTEVLGEYTPVTYEVYNYELGEYEEVIASGLAGVDWLYIGGLVLLIICVASVFKLIGGIICNRS